ncbi:MAG: hypothetical protein NZ954_01900 [Thermofilaceae archaeon]|nr:hypothetical protein [Thermofilaceae archaeon]MDW8003425.1 hypothetical protein [Thermofilaceae archaeon]
MIVEVDEKLIKLSWRELAILIVLHLIGWKTLTLSDVELIVAGHSRAVRLVARLKELDLVEEYSVRGTKLYTLSELGEKVAEEVKKKMVEANLWSSLVEALGDAYRQA